MINFINKIATTSEEHPKMVAKKVEPFLQVTRPLL